MQDKSDAFGIKMSGLKFILIVFVVTVSRVDATAGKCACNGSNDCHLESETVM